MAGIKNESQNQTGDTSVLTDTTITIKGIKEGSDDLLIEGGDKTITTPEKWVKWEITTPLVSEIYLILPDHDPSTIFSIKPNNQHSPKEWKGKIKVKEDLPPLKSVEEKYTIIYKRQAPDNKLYIYDPIIQVNT